MMFRELDLIYLTTQPNMVLLANYKAFISFIKTILTMVQYYMRCFIVGGIGQFLKIMEVIGTM
ncbi:hypothetical protein D3C85_1532850 [compost metagenome]